MKFNFIGALALIALCNTANAIEKSAKDTPVSSPSWTEETSLKTSLFMYQPEAGVFQLTPNFGLSWLIIKGEPKGTAEVSATQFGLSAEYGINEILSAGVSLTHGQAKTKISGLSFDVPDSTASGMTDPSIRLTGRVRAGRGLLRFGGHLDISTADSKANNLSSGGNTLNAYVGYELSKGSATYGGRMAYDFYKSTQTAVASDGSKSKTTGGKDFAIAAFYETDLHPILIGTSATISASDETTVKQDGYNDLTLTGSTNLALTLYGHYIVNPDFVILPSIGYAMPTAFNRAAIKSMDTLATNIGARFSF